MDKRAVIGFESYIVDKLDFKINKAFNNQDEVQLSLDFDLNLGINEEEKKAVVELNCFINKEYEEKNKPFYLNIIISGLFSYSTDLESDKLENMLSTNAVAIIFPYLRSIIGTVTLNSGIEPVVLPTINVAEMIKSKQPSLN